MRAFKAFAPAALAGIGNLPGTLHDRSIRIVLLPADPDQLGARFDSLHTEIETVLCRKLARWVRDNFAALQACDPLLPPTAFNRLADNWRPLLAIAQIVGGDWPRRALKAFEYLTGKSDIPAQAMSATLLADIRLIFSKSARTRITSKELLDALCALPDRPWLSAARAARSPFNWLASQLRPLEIASHNVRLGAQRAKGYELSDFACSFARFLDDAPERGSPDPQHPGLTG